MTNTIFYSVYHKDIQMRPKAHHIIQTHFLMCLAAYLFLFLNRLIRLRNIWIKTFWTGDWSERSELWDNVPPHEMPPEGVSPEAEGIFWISTRDFLRFLLIYRIKLSMACFYLFGSKHKILYN